MSFNFNIINLNEYQINHNNIKQIFYFAKLNFNIFMGFQNEKLKLYIHYIMFIIHAFFLIYK